MGDYMKRIIFFAMICIFLYDVESFATNNGTHQSSFSWPTITRTDQYAYNDIILNENKRDVKFTQDNDYYYFDIAQSLSQYFGTSWSTPCEHENSPDLMDHTFSSRYNICFAPFSNINQIFYYYKRTDRDVSTNLESYISFGSFNASNAIYKEVYKVSNLGNVQTDTRMCKYTFWYDMNLYEKDGEIGKHTAPSVLSYWSSKNNYVSQGYRNSAQYYQSMAFDIKYKVKIKKDEIDNFRYCMPLHDIYAHASYRDSGSTTGWSMSVNNAIDLKAYVECDHNWVYKDKYDRDKHTRYCEYCEWEIPEAHDYIYEYDGIENDRCICGNNKNVYITIKDNIGKINERYLTTPSEALHPIVWEDVGYDFLYVDDRELLYNDIDDSEYVVASVSYIPAVVPDNSHEYNINYYIHKYYVRYNKTNDYDLEIDATMPVKEIYYGDKVHLDKSLYDVTGYTFMGWSVEPDLSEVLFRDEQEIINISPEDGYVLNVYPVYDPYKYIVRFTPGRGYGYMSDQVCTYGVCEDIKGYQYHLDDEASFLNWYYKGVDIKPNVTTTLERFVDRDGALIVLDSRVYVRERNEKAGWDNSPTKKPDRGRIKTEIGPGVMVETPNVEERLVFTAADKSIRYDDKKDDDDKDDDKDSRMYLMVATGSVVYDRGSGINTRDSLFFRGVLLAINIAMKMAFCMIIIAIMVLCMAVIIYNSRKVTVRKYIKN